MGLLRSRSRSQRRFKMLVNVCPDDVFWTTERFIAKPGMIMQRNKPECRGEKWFTVFNVKVTASAFIIKMLLFLLYLLHCWSVCNQTWFESTVSWAGVPCGTKPNKPMVVQHQNPVCVQGQGYSEGSKCQWMYVRMIFSLCVRSCPLNIFWTLSHFFNQTWYGGVVSWGDVSCGKIGSLSSMSRSQRGLM